ncbi:MAG: phosphoribosylanthranilate isomerase [Pseudomonadota bacterium]
MAMVKICGVTDVDTARIAGEAGADWVGVVFHPKSPRYVNGPLAGDIAAACSPAKAVALLVDPDNLMAEELPKIGFRILQLHGNETPERVAEIKADLMRYEPTLGRPIRLWKAFGVSTRDDLRQAGDYAMADNLLLDAKPPRGADRTGGHGVAFDWSILSDWKPKKSWLLAGGLNPENVADAIQQTGAPAVDVSSGVESAPGVKDPAKIVDFIKAAKAA